MSMSLSLSLWLAMGMVDNCRLISALAVPWTVSGNYARDDTAFVFSLTDGKERPPKQCTQVRVASTDISECSLIGRWLTVGWLVACVALEL
jgi:hypothetical protein